MIIPFIKENVVTVTRHFLQIYDLDECFDKDVKDEITLYTYLIESCANDIYVVFWTIDEQQEYQKWSKRTRVYDSLSSIYGSIMPFPYSLYPEGITPDIEPTITAKQVTFKNLFK